MRRPGKSGMQIAAIVALAMGLAVPGADAAKFSPDMVKIERPGHGEGIHTPGAKIKLKVLDTAKVRAMVGGRNVTRRLNLRITRRHGRTRIVRGTVPRALVKGPPTTLRFTARSKRRRGSAQVLVQAVRNNPRFLSLKLRRGGRGKLPVVAMVRTKTHRIYLTAELNGRTVEDVADPTKLGVRRLTLTANEGLRRGRNVLVVRANDSRGRGTVKRRVFRIKRSVIPGVRGPGTVRPGAPVRLDAGPSTGGPNRKFKYRWRFSARPSGSHAKIRGAKHRVGRFRPDVPGHYAVKLKVRHRGAAKSSRAAGVSARRGGTGSLTVGVDTQLPIDPYGLILHADATEIVIGETKMPMTTTPGAMLLVPIDEVTGVVGKAQTIPPGGPNGQRDAQALTAAITALDPDKLVVVAAPPGSTDPSFQVGTDTWPSIHFGTAIESLGFGDSYDLQTQIVDGGAFALAGSPGDPPEAGVANPQTGVIDARLRPVGVSKAMTGILALEQPDYRLLKLGGGSGQVTVSTVNPGGGAAADQPVDLPLGPGDVMRVTILDARTLAPIDPVLSNTTANGTDGQVGTPLKTVRTLLEKYADDPNAMILFKMNAPTAYYHNRSDISAISKALARLGGNRDLFLRSLQFGANPTEGFINPPFVPYPGAEYVFIGGAGMQPVEGSALSGNGSGADGGADASGVLRQDGLSRWTPAATGASDAIDQSLEALAVRAPVAYAYPNTVSPAEGEPTVPGSPAQYHAAELQLYKTLIDGGVFCVTSPGCSIAPGVRVNYANPTLYKQDTKLTKATNTLKCDGGAIQRAAGVIYTQVQLDALRTMICGELKSIQLIHANLFGELADIYSDLGTDTQLDLIGKGDILEGYLQEKQDLDKENKFLGISGEAGTILSELFSSAIDVTEYILAPETGGASILAGKIVSTTLGVAGSALGIAGEAAGAGGSADKVAPEEITVGNLLTQIKASYDYAGQHARELEALIASDPTKLAEAAANAQGTDKKVGPIWDLTQAIPHSDSYTVEQVIKFQQRLATHQYMLPRMIATVSKTCNGGGSPKDPTTYGAWTALREGRYKKGYSGGGIIFLTPEEQQLRSVHLKSDDAKTIGNYLFGSAFGDDVATALTTGPVGAALAPSPFFMTQIAPTSTAQLDSWKNCGEDL